MKWISRIFHPVILSIAALVITGAGWWTLVHVGINLVPTTLFILYMVKTGRFSDIDVSDQKQRNTLSIVSVLLAVTSAIVFTVGNAPRNTRLLIYAMVTCTSLVGAVVNLWSKISLHSMTAASAATGLAFVFWPVGLLFGVVALMVGWSRIKLKRHTPGQVYAGWLVAVAFTAVIFYFL